MSIYARARARVWLKKEVNAPSHHDVRNDGSDNVAAKVEIPAKGSPRSDHQQPTIALPTTDAVSASAVAENEIAIGGRPFISARRLALDSGHFDEDPLSLMLGKQRATKCQDRRQGLLRAR